MKSIRTEPLNHAAEGDERIRTAVPSLGADPAYERRAADSNAAEQWRIDRAERQASSAADRGVPAPSTDPAYDRLADLHSLALSWIAGDEASTRPKGLQYNRARILRDWTAEFARDDPEKARAC